MVGRSIADIHHNGSPPSGARIKVRGLSLAGIVFRGDDDNDNGDNDGLHEWTLRASCNKHTARETANRWFLENSVPRLPSSPIVGKLLLLLVVDPETSSQSPNGCSSRNSCVPCRHGVGLGRFLDENILASLSIACIFARREVLVLMMAILLVTYLLKR